jgi:pimeloyl-ACP methyl ester carboxylesterase
VILKKRTDGFLHRMVDVGAVRLHVVEARPQPANEEVPADVPLVVFLHGFPELWLSWKHQLRAFGDAGFWAVAPDMRGYNESDKPEGVTAYEVEQLSADVAGLIRALGRKSAIVVGHDWGAVVAWWVAQLHPSVVSRLAILNEPHPLQMTRGLRRLEQVKKSWYVFFFQLPRIPERIIARDDFAQVRRTLGADGFTNEEIQPYVDALKVPGALTAALNYYRAAIRRVLTGRTPKMAVIECPVLVIWGDKDRFLGKEMAAPPARFVPDSRVVHVPEASHWVQNAAPDKVNHHLFEFAPR